MVASGKMHKNLAWMCCTIGQTVVVNRASNRPRSVVNIVPRNKVIPLTLCTYVRRIADKITEFTEDREPCQQRRFKPYGGKKRGKRGGERRKRKERREQNLENKSLSRWPRDSIASSKIPCGCHFHQFFWSLTSQCQNFLTWCDPVHVDAILVFKRTNFALLAPSLGYLPLHKWHTSIKVNL